MKDTLIGLVKALVDNPTDVAVTESTQDGRTVFTVSVNPQDMGKIIGKGGRIIRAVRDLMKILATKKGVYIDVVIAEDYPEGQAVEPSNQ
ncbi:KH domain-containing protein [Candidatus Gottesmanbacteria bacterium]|nr:KH domain-containing protein [Candidatus Gottesmanbacteria bacterium]